MRHSRRLALAAALAAVALGLALPLGAQRSSDVPDVKRGAVIAAQGTSQGVPACAQCHAFNGASDGSGAFPRLAGQSADYLRMQLRDFASGVRNSALMTQIAKSLTPDETADVAAYYASKDAPFPPLKSMGAALVKRGEQLAKVGSAAEQIPSCNACHGPGGAGEPPVIPYLAGQYAQYIELNLRMWQKGLRKNSADGMAIIADKLSPQDIEAVAAYYQQLTPSLEASLTAGKP